MQWYKHYISDFDQATADLPMLERGAYRELLDAYYQREGALPADRPILYRLVKAHTKREKAAIESVLRRHFKLVNGEDRERYTNSRCDEEILKYQQQCTANRRPNGSANRPRIANESPPESAIELRERDRYKTPLPPLTGKKKCITCGQPAIEFMNYQWHCEDHIPYKQKPTP